ncbi:hypothetical protein ACF0H5_013761 [Mactra antiquata]
MKLRWNFADADVFHSKKNKIKMSSGQPLTDEDRLPWLCAIHEHLSRLSVARESGIVACSALKRKYRDILCYGLKSMERNDLEENTPNTKLDLHFVHLTGSKSILESRLQNRLGHFMPVTLLESQLETLEELASDELGISVNVEKSVESQVNEIIAELGLML